MRLLLKMKIALGLVLMMGISPLWAANEQMVLGAGPSAKVAQSFFKAFEKQPEAQGYTFAVEQRSTKHAGGIRASGSSGSGRRAAGSRGDGTSPDPRDADGCR